MNTTALNLLKDLLHQLGEQARTPVPSNRIDFVFDNIKVGHIDSEDALWLSETFRFFRLASGRLNFDSGNHNADTRLAAVSTLYKNLDKVFAWRDELLPVVPFTDTQRTTVLGKIERAMCRPFALNTFAVHLNPFTEDGRLWVGQRSFKKAIGPGYWDNCAAGMVPLGESFESAMDREAWEEAGIAPSSLNLRYIGSHLISRPVREGWMQENTIMYTSVVRDDFLPHNIDGEVAQFELLDAETVIQRIEKGLFTFESSLSVLLAIAELNGLSAKLEDY